MVSVVLAPLAVSSLANPTRPLCAVKCASIPAARAGSGELIAWTVGELLESFYRGGGKVRRSGERPGDWELIRRACQWISGAKIPWRVPSGNAQPWAIMMLRSLPSERPALSDPVVFDVRLPPGAGPGPAVDRPALRAAGRVSSPAFRIDAPAGAWRGRAVDRRRQPLPGVLGTRQAADRLRAGIDA